MQLYFIRHGQSKNNAIWYENNGSDEYRVSDPILTEKGILQAQLAGKFLSQQNPELQYPWIDIQNRQNFGLTHLYCSLMERAIQTGLIIANELNLPLVGHPDLHEVGGIYVESENNGVPSYSIEHGITPYDLQERYPSLTLSKTISDDGWWRGGKEERAERLARAHRIVEMLKQKHSGTEDRIGIITHGGIFAYIFRVLFRLDLNTPPDSRVPYQIVLNNCGISRFDLIEEETLFLYHNRTDFLPDDLIT